MNRDEKVVYEYLRTHYGNDVVFEPIKNEPPDFLLNSSIAIEVRRLNQHFFADKNIEGLENLSFSIRKALKEVLQSFDSAYKGSSYCVHIEYERPFSSSLERTKKDLQNALTNFIDQDISVFPYRKGINPEFIIEIDHSSPVDGRVFRAGGEIDENAEGLVVQTYSKNMKYCIQVKLAKINNNFQLYGEWWLYLVDHLSGGLNSQEERQIISNVGSIGVFRKVIVLDPNDCDIQICISNEVSK